MGGDEGGMTINVTVTWGPGVDPGTEKGLWLENWLNSSKGHSLVNILYHC